MTVQPSSPFWNVDENRPRAGLRIPAFLVIQGIMLSLLGLSLGSLLLSFTNSDASSTALTPATQAVDVRLISALTTLLAALFSVWIAGRLVDRRQFSGYGLSFTLDWIKGWTFGLAVGGVVISGLFVLQWGLGWIQITEVFAGNWSSLLTVLGPIFFFAFAAFAEDLIYWGYLLTNLSEGLASSRLGQRLPVILSLVAVSSFFALGHALNPGATLVSTFNIAVAGIMLALGYLLTGQLAITVGLHFSWNLFQGYVFGFPVSGLDPTGATIFSIERTGPPLWDGGSFGPEAGILGLLAMLTVCGIILLSAWIRGEASISPDISSYKSPQRDSNRTE